MFLIFLILIFFRLNFRHLLYPMENDDRVSETQASPSNVDNFEDSRTSEIGNSEDCPPPTYDQFIREEYPNGYPYHKLTTFGNPQPSVHGSVNIEMTPFLRNAQVEVKFFYQNVENRIFSKLHHHQNFD